MAVWLAALMLAAAVALFVAAPLTEASAEKKSGAEDDAERVRLEHERGLATAGIRELEFDHAMNKLAENEFQSVRRRLEARALAAMAGLARIRGAASGPADRHIACARCGAAQPEQSSKFCVDCGATLPASAAAN